MFKKKTSTNRDSVRRPGQALEDIRLASAQPQRANSATDTTAVTAEERDERKEPIDSSSDSDSDASSPSHPSIDRPRKRVRRTYPDDLSLPHSTITATPNQPFAPLTSDPTLITVASSRSALPDTSSHSHRHVLFAPKHEPTAVPSQAALSLPSTSAAPSARFGPQKASGYARAISRVDYQPDVCVAAGTPVTLANGSSKAIEMVVAGDLVLSFDRSRNGLIPMAVSSDAKWSGVQECLELLFSDGAVLAVTADHRILTDAQQWVRADHLVVGHSYVSVGMKCPLQSAEDKSKSRRKAQEEKEVLVDEPQPQPPAAAQSAEQPIYGAPVGADARPMFRAKLLAARQVGPRAVYDLSVPQAQEDDRSFVAAGVCVHNCKDWMECGSCGYGDSCKFLHDRLNYKAGWELERDWEAQQKKDEAKRREDTERRERGETVVDPASGAGKARVQLPFACYLCRQPFTNPVVTACGHYFDERCALARFAKTGRCAVCGKETHGSFTQATELLRELDKEKKAAKGKAVGGDGEEDNGEDDADVSDGRFAVR